MGPSVSVVIPARDEGPYIEACVRSVLDQVVDTDLEVLVIDSASTDHTAHLARRAGAVVIDNPEGSIPSALNRGLAAAQGGVFARFDGHGEMVPGYLASCLAALAEEDNAGNVGGWCRVVPTGRWGRAMAAALASPIGVGNARRWRSPADDRRHDVDSVAFGCYPIGLLRELGGWRSDLVANEDYEMNWRVRRLGRRVVFDPAIWSLYRPRESLGAIFRQYWRYGRGKAAMLRAAGAGSLQPRQLMPPGLVLTGVAATLPGVPGRAGRLTLAAYGGALAATAAASDGGWRTAPVLASMHVGWGSAFLWGTIERSWTSPEQPSS